MKLTRTMIATTLAILASSGAGGQTLQPIDQLAVVDANGKAVGKFIELFKGDATTALVALKVNDLVFEVWWGHDGPTYNNSYANPSFQSTDCSGQPFSDSFGDSTPALEGATNVALGVPGNTLYAPAGPPQPVTLVSYLDPTGTCNPVQYQPFGGTAVPVQALLNLDTLFTPPFRLTTTSGSTSGAQCCGDCNCDGQVTIDEILTSVNHALNGCSAP